MARMLRWLLPLTLAEWRHHPWRHGAALLAVALGVALAWSVHLINTSALAEFASAVRAANGEPDLTLRGRAFDDALFERVASDAGVQIASPVLEVDTYARAADGRRVAVRVLGVDALLAAPLAPALWPRLDQSEDRLAFLDPAAAFVNASASQALAARDGALPGSAAAQSLQLQVGERFVALRRAGSVAIAGTPTIVMDLAGAQQHFGRVGRLSRIDLRLAPGSDAQALLTRLALPVGVNAMAAGEAEQRVSSVSRAYRVNLTVLALVALFVGAFLVFSVVSLSVAQRTPALALLGVLGLSARDRQRWVLAECAALGAVGSAIGLLLGAALAAAALRLLAGDLGGGYFPGIVPPLRLAWHEGAGFGLLGVASAMVGGWLPARQAARLAPAQALKGLGSAHAVAPPAWPGVLLLSAGAAAAFAPPIAGLPLAAYAAVAALLFGGVALIPAAVHALLAAAPTVTSALPLLALRRARFQRHTAVAAVAGVVASLALSVALTVMVSSFRDGVGRWLDTVLPADLYARSTGSGSAAEQVWLTPEFVARVAQLPGVDRLEAARLVALPIAAGQPAATLIARPLRDPAASLPLLRAPLVLPPGQIGAFVSEAMVSLHGARPGTSIELPLDSGPLRVHVRGVWRDYARQFGTVVMDDADYRRLSGDTRLNDLALWLTAGADAAAVEQAVRHLLADPAMLDFASTSELRRRSLRIFDRSFAVTYYLQAVAIVIGLVGITASLSAQVLARRKEFGLLSHLGLTRAQVVAVVAGEAAAWTAAGVLLGVVLGLAISVVLVFVVNPQSFHWTMDLVLPWGRLAGLAATVLLAGVATAALCARNAASRQAVLSVKEDW